MKIKFVRGLIGVDSMIVELFLKYYFELILL